MCEYCDPDMGKGYGPYHGKDIELIDIIDGKNQNFELTIVDDIDLEQKVLSLYGTHSNFNVLINYCPMCGNKL